MKVIRIAAPGGPEAMSLDEVETPTPGPGQALIAVRAAGVNYIDVYQRTGQYALPLPASLGQEGAGEVIAIGAGVDLALGARVAWTGILGSYATHVLAPAERLVELPAGIDFPTAAAAMLQGMTAHYLTQSTYRLAPGERCVVHAAAGGVGLLLCQLARRAGATAFGTTSSELKAQRARKAGAAEVIRYDQVDFAAEVRRLTGDRGVEVVYDSVGKSTFDRSLDCLAPRGMMVLFGQSSGAVPPFDLQRLNQKGSLFVTRPNLAHYIRSRGELVARATEVLSWIASGKLQLAIDRRLPLAQAAEAHRLLESRTTSGKLLLLPEP